MVQGGTTSGYSFTGRELDVEVGLHYYRARYYDSRNARWMSDDPIGLADGPNQTTYVGNSPLRFVDPLGLAGKGPEKMEVTHKGEVFNKSTPWRKVWDAYKDAIKGKMNPKHVRALKGLAKVIKRERGVNGALGPLCIVYDCGALYDQFEDIIEEIKNPRSNKCMA